MDGKIIFQTLENDGGCQPKKGAEGAKRRPGIKQGAKTIRRKVTADAFAGLAIFCLISLLFGCGCTAPGSVVLCTPRLFAPVSEAIGW
jgi:hypothetical protein